MKNYMPKFTSRCCYKQRDCNKSLSEFDLSGWFSWNRCGYNNDLFFVEVDSGNFNFHGIKSDKELDWIVSETFDERQ